MKLLGKSLMVMVLWTSVGAQAQQNMEIGEVYQNSEFDYKVVIDGHMTDSGVFHYDQNLGKSLLRFYINHRPQGFVADSFYGRPLKFMNKRDLLFTTFDISSLGAHYNTNEAPIYLKKGRSVVQIGKFQPITSDMPTDEQLNTFNYPILCSGEFENVCQLKLQFSGTGNDQSVEVSVQIGWGRKVKSSIHLQGFYDRSYAW
tara:strand:+ start:1350 stop:1952 length:603 start_codon:yes stop_codon:yes gene_type:complete